MKSPAPNVSGFELVIEAFEAWIAFFVVTWIVEMSLSETWFKQVMLLLTGAIAIGFLTRRWHCRIEMRHHVANLALLVAGLLIGIDMIVVITELSG